MATMLPIYVVDIECLLGVSGADIVKELAIVKIAVCNNALQLQMQSWLFKPPYVWQNLNAKQKKTNNWLTNNRHGIKWSDGDVEYEKFHEVLRRSIPSQSAVYIKGLKKSNYIGDILDVKIFELGKIGCPKAEDIWASYTACLFHSASHIFNHCAQFKAHKGAGTGAPAGASR